VAYYRVKPIYSTVSCHGEAESIITAVPCSKNFSWLFPVKKSAQVSQVYNESHVDYFPKQFIFLSKSLALKDDISSLTINTRFKSPPPPIKLLAKQLQTLQIINLQIVIFGSTSNTTNNFNNLQDTSLKFDANISEDQKVRECGIRVDLLNMSFWRPYSSANTNYFCPPQNIHAPPVNSVILQCLEDLF
jgi:hypothetical protein